MTEKIVTADSLRRYDQIKEDSGAFIVLSVEKSWKVTAWGDLCKAGEAPQRVKREFSPHEEITIFR